MAFVELRHLEAHVCLIQSFSNSGARPPGGAVRCQGGACDPGEHAFILLIKLFFVVSGTIFISFFIFFNVNKDTMLCRGVL